MIAAQVAHAAGAGSDRHPPEVHVVVLSVPSEGALLCVAQRLQLSGAAHTTVVESDSPYSGQAMSIGLELLRDRSAAYRALSSLPLLKALGSQTDSHRPKYVEVSSAVAPRSKSSEVSAQSQEVA